MAHLENPMLPIQPSASLDFIPGRRRGTFKLGESAKATGERSSLDSEPSKQKKPNPRALVKRRTADAFNFFRNQEKEAKKKDPAQRKRKKKRKFFGINLKRESAPVVSISHADHVHGFPDHPTLGNKAQSLNLSASRSVDYIGRKPISPRSKLQAAIEAKRTVSNASPNHPTLGNKAQSLKLSPTRSVDSHLTLGKTQSLKLSPTRSVDSIKRPISPRSKLEVAIEAKRSLSNTAPRKRSRLEEAIEERARTSNKPKEKQTISKLDRAISDRKSKDVTRAQKRLKALGRIKPKKKFVFASSVIFEDHELEPSLAHSELNGRNRIMSINKKTIMNRQNRHISVVNRGSVVKRAKAARAFFETGAKKQQARSPGLSIVEKPNLARTRIVSIVGRASVADRAESARKKFTKVKKSTHYRPTDCPGCGMTVYFRERFKDNWHRRCYELDQKLSQPGAEVETPYGRGVILLAESSQVVVDLHWGTAHLQKNCVQPTNETVDAFVHSPHENIDFHAGKNMFRSLEKNNSEMLNPECPGCGDKVFLAEDHTKLGGHLWHQSCFKCQICSSPLKQTFKDHERKPMCYRCYEEEVLCDYWCAVLNADDYQCEIPNNYLSSLEITHDIWSLLTLINKNKVKFFTIIIRSEVALVPEMVFLKKCKDVLPFDDSMLENVPKKKIRSDCTSAKEYSKFWNTLVKDTEAPRCCIGIIHLVFKLNANEEISRICEKVVACVSIPESAPVKQKLLYGATAGIIHNDAPSVSKVIAGACKDDFRFGNVLTACRKDFKY